MTFSTRGLIEGFYDRLWTWDERARIAEFVAARGFNAYVHAPKEDRLQNAGWRQPYPEAELRAQAAFGERCRALGMAFWIGLRPVGISYAGDADVAALIDKLRGSLDRGADGLMLLADDIPPELGTDPDPRFGSLADAHVWLVERVLEGLDLRPTRLIFVPTHYAGSGSPYLDTVGAAVPRGVEVCWTGRDVCTPEILSSEADAIAAVLRRPPMIWDNYPVNDDGMTGQLHIGPIRGRDATLAAHVSGVLVNPALEPEATLVPLATWSEYLRDPAGYDADGAWRRALLDVAGNAEDADAVALLAAVADRSVIRQGWPSPPARQLDGLRARIARLRNARLAADLRRFTKELAAA